MTHANEKEIGHLMGYPFKRFAKQDLVESACSHMAALQYS